jgi:hypothetical protein
MKNKKIILIAGSLFMYLFFLSYQTLAPKGLCDVNNFILCGYSMDQIRNIFNFFPLILFFSLLTYNMSQAVFATWWKFARWAIPAGFALVILVNLRLHHTPGGWLNMDAQIDLLLVGLVYGIFVIGSIVSIVRGYKSKNRLMV